MKINRVSIFAALLAAFIPLWATDVGRQTAARLALENAADDLAVRLVPTLAQ